MKLGAQLYTLRKQMQTPDEIEHGLERIAKMGYSCVQISGIGKIDAQRLRAVCDRLSLEIAVTHIPSDRLLGDTARVIEEHKIMDCRYVGLGSMPKGYRSAAGVDEFKQYFTRAIEELRAADLEFTYHNHAFEFERTGGSLIFDRLLKAFSPEQMKVTLDCYWVNYGGADVCDWIDRLSGRIDCVHLKDYGIANDKIVMLPVGEGNMNYPRILEHLEKAGTKYALVEQDDCNGEDPFDCLERSCNNLKKYF